MAVGDVLAALAATLGGAATGRAQGLQLQQEQRRRDQLVAMEQEERARAFDLQQRQFDALTEERAASRADRDLQRSLLLRDRGLVDAAEVAPTAMQMGAGGPMGAVMGGARLAQAGMAGLDVGGKRMAYAPWLDQQARERGERVQERERTVRTLQRLFPGMPVAPDADPATTLAVLQGREAQTAADRRQERSLAAQIAAQERATARQLAADERRAEAAARAERNPAKATDGERTAFGFGARMAAADAKVSQLEQAGETGRPNAGQLVAGALPFVGNRIATGIGSRDNQLYRQAAEDWVRAKLRKESGAAIGKDEMAQEIATYFPQLGDSPEVIQQKAQSRAMALQNMGVQAGRLWQPDAITSVQEQALSEIVRLRGGGQNAGQPAGVRDNVRRPPTLRPVTR